MRLCPWSLALALSIPVLGLESVCSRKGCPWPWPRIFFVSLALASSLVSSTPPLEITSSKKWMIAIKLTLHLSKSNVILIEPKSRGHRANLSIISSTFVSNLPSVNMSKYLDLIFDNFLSFEPHINNLAHKLS